MVRGAGPGLGTPQRSFWIRHKAGDGGRGLHQPSVAAAHYRQALAEGSSSALTARNLLQVLHGLAPEQALAELARWPQPLAPARLEGAQAAAALVAGLELVMGVEARRGATPPLQPPFLDQPPYVFIPALSPVLAV